MALNQAASISIVSTVACKVVDLYTIGFNGRPLVSTREWWPVTAVPSQTTVFVTQTALSTPSPTTNSSGLNGGAIAGIAIATSLVGGLLGILAGLLLARRYKKQEPLPEYIAYSDREKEAPTSTTAADQLHFDQFLLDPKPDSAITSELRSLGRLVNEHAQAHYHLQPVQLESSKLRQPLYDLGIEKGSAPAIARLASLAIEPRTRLNAIRYVICKAAFESTVISGGTCVSLLPPMVSNMSSSAPPLRDHLGSHEITELALVRWRQLSAFLLHPNRSQRTPLVPTEEISTQQAQKLTIAVNRFLEPFVPREREERYEQENHLREVIVECATFGYLLFSQPAEYRFRFESNRGMGTIVVCPGMDKVMDEEGRRYQPQVRQLMAPVTESV
ncbi:hypothetical protein GGS21DRAFT_200062 [Xylaria nigripes]|nr:hypothetical protein GGS21DRAFT_200062 [Xylaria nigripes]